MFAEMDSWSNYTMKNHEEGSGASSLPRALVGSYGAAAILLGVIGGVAPLISVGGALVVLGTIGRPIYGAIQRVIIRSRQRAHKKKKNPGPAREEMAAYLQDYPWDASPHRVEPPKLKRQRFGHKLSTSSLDENGVGVVNWKYSTLHYYGSTNPTHIHPYANLSTSDFPVYMDLRGANLGGAQLWYTSFDDADFTGANLENADCRQMAFLQPENQPYGSFTSSLRGANCRGADFTKAKLRLVGLTDTDFAGANLTGAVLPENLSGVNITAEQYTSLHEGYYEDYEIPKATIDDIAQVLGESAADVAMRLWAGDVQVLERGSNAVVATGSFNEEKHFIPTWEMRRLRNENEVS
jgi:hypothetical protein